jgi:hypothetical protein
MIARRTYSRTRIRAQLARCQLTKGAARGLVIEMACPSEARYESTLVDVHLFSGRGRVLPVVYQRRIRRLFCFLALSRKLYSGYARFEGSRDLRAKGPRKFVPLQTPHLIHSTNIAQQSSPFIVENLALHLRIPRPHPDSSIAAREYSTVRTPIEPNWPVTPICTANLRAT